MRRLVLCCSVFVLSVILAVSIARTSAQDASPPRASANMVTLVPIEHAVFLTDVNQHESEVSIGDLTVWGPNPLYDETDSQDTGATTQGVCIALNSDFDCLASETIVFADGSTLEIQGVERGNAQRSTRTIVGGSGQYLGAAGTVAVTPAEDRTKWSKTIEIVVPGGA